MIAWTIPRECSFTTGAVFDLSGGRATYENTKEFGMRLGRVRLDGSVWLARLEVDQWALVARESDHPAADAIREAIEANTDLTAAGTLVATADVEVLAPIANPSKIICVGLNYADHAEEAGLPTPETPVIFAKYPNTISGPTDDIWYRPADATQLDYEAELAVVVGATCSRVEEDDALEYVLGYMVMNDLSARNAQFADGQWVRGKSFDNFAPIGPTIATKDEIGDVHNLRIRCIVNGDIMQDGNTSNMVFDVGTIVSYLSQYMTLLPGDMIATGTPAGVGVTRTPPVLLKDGDVLVTEIEHIGRLENVIRAE